VQPAGGVAFDDRQGTIVVSCAGGTWKPWVCRFVMPSTGMAMPCTKVNGGPAGGLVPGDSAAIVGVGNAGAGELDAGELAAEGLAPASAEPMLWNCAVLSGSPMSLDSVM
jgi:hypothetical protein